jgi:hypothetical protein
MKKTFFILLFLPVYLYGESAPIGRFVQSHGRIERNSINCPYGVCAESSTEIFAGDRIKTADNSGARIMLNEGTSIEVRGASDFTIFSIRRKREEGPTRIYADYGTFTVIQNNSFTDASLAIGTRASLIKSVDASMYIIAAIDETSVMVYRNRAGVAGSLPSDDTAFILKEGDEIFIKTDKPPAVPAGVEPLLRGSWLSKNFLSPDRRRIIRTKRDSTVIDWLFRNRD